MRGPHSPDPPPAAAAQALERRLVVVLVAALVFALGLLTVLLTPEGSRTAAWWPAAGVAVAAVARLHGSPRTPTVVAVWLASVAANLVGGRSLTVAVGFATGNAVEAALAGWWLTRDRPMALAELRDVLRLCTAALLGASAAGITAGGVVALAGGDLLSTTWAVTASHASAVLVIAPLVLAAPRVRADSHHGETAACWAAAVLMTVAVFFPGQQLPLAFLVIPVLVWTGLRLGVRGACLQVLVLGGIVCALTARGAGPFAEAGRVASPAAAGLLIQLFLVASALVVLSLAVVVRQREAALLALSEHREFAEHVLEAVSAGVLACDATGEIVLRNAAQRRITGVADGVEVSSEQVAAGLRVVGPEGVELDLQHSPLRRAMAGEQVDALPVQIGPVGGPASDVVITARSIQSSSGKLLGAVAAFTDVTGERRVQAELRRSVLALQARELELQRTNDDLAAVARATKAVLAGGDARTAVCEAAYDVAGALAVVLMEPDRTGTVLRSTVTTGMAPPDLAAPTGDLSRSALAFATGRTQLVADVRNDEAFDPRVVAKFDEVCGHDVLQSAIFVPLVHEGGTRGVLAVALRGPVATADLRVLGLLDVLATDACLAMSREDLARDLAEQAVTDPLTGLPNRRRWDEELHRAAAAATRSGAPYTVLVLDLDHFKRFNDTFGHPAGDALLVQAAQAWRAVLRTDDVLARTGGEEFSVLLRSCTADQARTTAQRLIDAVPLAQSCSIGMACSRTAELPAGVVARADGALYEAKAQGRARLAVGG